MSGSKTISALGFLTAIEHPQQGVLGGYLVLNLAGRPMEFHCTAPVKPNRAQQILYGPTLEPYIYGELIGATLLEKSTSHPVAVFTDLPTMLAARPYTSLPLAFVHSAETRIDSAHALASPVFSRGKNRLSVHGQHGEDQEKVLSKLKELDSHFDLNEPFGRIREALKEAQQ